MRCHISVSAITVIFLHVILDTSDGRNLDVDKVGIPKIIGGKDTNKGKWPWQALMVIKKSDSVTLCGGTLIHPKWVITAAHCAFKASRMTIYFGIWNVTSKTEQGRLKRTSSKVIIHPCYDDNKGTDLSGINLALVELDRPVRTFQPACLGDQHAWKQLKNGKTLSSCVATGYGVMDSGKRAEILQEVEFSNVSMTSCRIYGKTLKDKTICAFDEYYTSKDACRGDMGGPLVCPTLNYGCNGYYLLAVTIAGNTPCGGDISSRPGLYSAIDPNLEWIQHVMNKREHHLSAIFCGTKNLIKLATTKAGGTQSDATQTGNP